MPPLRALLREAGPSLLVVLPLAGLALQSAERLSLYLNAAATGTNPFRAARHAWHLTGTHLDQGTFAPLGRFTEYLTHGVALEAGQSLSLAPDAVLGAVRLALVAVTAVLAFRVVEALRRSAGTHRSPSLLALYPLACAAALVANGIGGGLAVTPHTSIGAVAVVLAAALAVARDRDLTVRTPTWPELAPVALLGAAAAAFDELAYLAPFVAAAFVAARVLAGGLAARTALCTAAARRWIALTAGFAVVYLPARFAIALRCSVDYSCTDGWILSSYPDPIGTAVARLGGSLPLAGWIANGDRNVAAGLDLGISAVLANSMLVMAVLALAAFASAAARRACATRPDTTEPAPQQERPHSHARLALALGGFGSAITGAAALYAGLSWWAQQLPFGHAVRQGWRETLLSQIGWSLIAAAVLAVADIAIHRRSASTRRALTTVAALVLAAAATATLTANWQLAQIDRHDSTASVTALVAASTVNMGISDSPAGIAELNDWPVRTDDVDYLGPPMAVRCALLDAYDGAGAAGTRHTPVSFPQAPVDTSQLRTELNRLMVDRYGVPYCDPAAVPAPAGTAQESEADTS
ncbi:MAG: hypothetical protein OXH86_06410 [Acidimicrobiaceae bacterium]|nr:hypothetical protein [Acidimicrobiaceae bacterium]